MNIKESDVPSQRLTFENAVEIWKLLWRGWKRSSMIARYKINNWRLYEIWRGEKFAGSREVALAELRKENPELAELAVTGVLDPKRRRDLRASDIPDLFGSGEHS